MCSSCVCFFSTGVSVYFLLHYMAPCMTLCLLLCNMSTCLSAFSMSCLYVCRLTCLLGSGQYFFMSSERVSFLDVLSICLPRCLSTGSCISTHICVSLCLCVCIRLSCLFYVSFFSFFDIPVDNPSFLPVVFFSSSTCHALRCLPVCFPLLVSVFHLFFPFVFSVWLHAS